MSKRIRFPLLNPDEPRPDPEELDHELRFLTRAQNQVHRAIGQGLYQLFSRDLLMLLSSARRADYIREHLGLGVRHAQELVRIESLLPHYPETEKLWTEGRISRCHVRELICRVPAEDEFAWARLATIMTVRDFKDKLAADGLQPLSGRRARDEEEGRYLQFEASADLRKKLEVARELVDRLVGVSVPDEAFLEACAAEWQSGVPDEAYRQFYEEGGPCTYDGRAELEGLKAERQRARQRETASWRSLSKGMPPHAALPDLAIPAGADAFAIDKQLRTVLRFEQELDSLLMHRLFQAQCIDMHKALTFDDLEHYAAERLGMSSTRLHTLLRLYRSLSNAPEVAQSYAMGELTMSKAEQIVRLATPPTVQAWIEYARTTTVRGLRAAVQAGARARRENRRRFEHILPPEPDVCTDPEAQAFLADTLARIRDEETTLQGTPPEKRTWAYGAEAEACSEQPTQVSEAGTSEKPTWASDTEAGPEQPSLVASSGTSEKPTCASDAGASPEQPSLVASSGTSEKPTWASDAEASPEQPSLVASSGTSEKPTWASDAEAGPEQPSLVASSGTSEKPTCASDAEAGPEQPSLVASSGTSEKPTCASDAEASPSSGTSEKPTCAPDAEASPEQPSLVASSGTSEKPTCAFDEEAAASPEQPSRVRESETSDTAKVPEPELPRVTDFHYSDIAGGLRRMRLWVPQELEDYLQEALGVCRVWLGRRLSVGQCLERMVDSFLAEYLPVAAVEAKAHPIAERDNWLCAVPGCTHKASLQDHHQKFRSRGGSDLSSNLSPVCSAHHLQGIHMDRMQSCGKAPDDLVWVLGIRPDGQPGQVYVGETLVYARD